MSTELNADKLMRQAPWTVNCYLQGAIREIDKAFGEGYAKAHPDLVGKFIESAAQDFHTAIISKEMHNLAANIGCAGQNIMSGLKHRE